MRVRACVCLSVWGNLRQFRDSLFDFIYIRIHKLQAIVQVVWTQLLLQLQSIQLPKSKLTNIQEIDKIVVLA